MWSMRLSTLALLLFSCPIARVVLGEWVVYHNFANAVPKLSCKVRDAEALRALAEAQLGADKFPTSQQSSAKQDASKQIVFLLVHKSYVQDEASSGAEKSGAKGGKKKKEVISNLAPGYKKVMDKLSEPDANRNTLYQATSELHSLSNASGFITNLAPKLFSPEPADGPVFSLIRALEIIKLGDNMIINPFVDLNFDENISLLLDFDRDVKMLLPNSSKTLNDENYAILKRLITFVDSGEATKPAPEVEAAAVSGDNVDDSAKESPADESPKTPSKSQLKRLKEKAKKEEEKRRKEEELLMAQEEEKRRMEEELLMAQEEAAQRALAVEDDEHKFVDPEATYQAQSLAEAEVCVAEPSSLVIEVVDSNCNQADETNVNSEAGLEVIVEPAQEGTFTEVLSPTCESPVKCDAPLELDLTIAPATSTDAPQTKDDFNWDEWQDAPESSEHTKEGEFVLVAPKSVEKVGKTTNSNKSAFKTNPSGSKNSPNNSKPSSTEKDPAMPKKGSLVKTSKFAPSSSQTPGSTNKPIGSGPKVVVTKEAQKEQASSKPVSPNSNVFGPKNNKKGPKAVASSSGELISLQQNESIAATLSGESSFAKSSGPTDAMPDFFTTDPSWLVGADLEGELEEDALNGELEPESNHAFGNGSIESDLVKNDYSDSWPGRGSGSVSPSDVSLFTSMNTATPPGFPEVNSASSIMQLDRLFPEIPAYSADTPLTTSFLECFLRREDLFGSNPKSPTDGSRSDEHRPHSNSFSTGRGDASSSNGNTSPYDTITLNPNSASYFPQYEGNMPTHLDMRPGGYMNSGGPLTSIQGQHPIPSPQVYYNQHHNHGSDITQPPGPHQGYGLPPHPLSFPPGGYPPPNYHPHFGPPHSVSQPQYPPSPPGSFQQNPTGRYGWVPQMHLTRGNSHNLSPNAHEFRPSGDQSKSNHRNKKSNTKLPYGK